VHAFSPGRLRHRPAGDAYIRDPPLVHAAQRHRGTEPRFMSQAPMFLAAPRDREAGTPRARPLKRASRPAP
jgi:hypothetical protein